MLPIRHARSLALAASLLASAVVQAEAPQAHRDVRVMLEDNKVVLRGTVPSEDVKERIENRAETAARGWDVESELRVSNPANR